LPNTAQKIGSSVRGRAITVAKFGSGPRRLLVVGGVHGDELGDDVARLLAARLRKEPSLVPANTTIHVIECLNPDGRAANTRGNSRKVDLNRNMPSKNWAPKLDKRDNSSTRGLSGGVSAGSEPESKALIRYLDQGFDVVISLHSRGGFVDFNGPGAEIIAKRISEVTGLPVQGLSYQPYIRGSMGLFIPENYRKPLITLELNSSKLTPPLLRGILSVAATN
jgi:protein MpaA